MNENEIIDAIQQLKAFFGEYNEMLDEREMALEALTEAQAA